MIEFGFFTVAAEALVGVYHSLIKFALTNIKRRNTIKRPDGGLLRGPSRSEGISQINSRHTCSKLCIA